MKAPSASSFRLPDIRPASPKAATASTGDPKTYGAIGRTESPALPPLSEVERVKRPHCCVAVRAIYRSRRRIQAPIANCPCGSVEGRSVRHPGAAVSLAGGEASDDGILRHIIYRADLLDLKAQPRLRFRAGREPFLRRREHGGLDPARAGL